MQKLIAVIPTYHRPEMLALTLEHLRQTNQADNLDCRIFVDHTSPERLAEVDYVRNNYFPTADIFHASNHVLLPSGTWNILQSLAAGYRTGADLIFMIEEDIFVTPDFFDRHIELQESGDYFVTSGRVLPNFDDTFYSNPGSCYRREKLSNVIPHICDEYFANPKLYLETRFPFMDDAGILDDGLIRRVMRSVGGQARCVTPPVAFHQGFRMYGKTAEYRVEGNIEERIAGLRTLLSKISPAGRYTRDFEPFPI